MIPCDSSLFAAASTQLLLARKSRSHRRACAQAAGETPETFMSLLPQLKSRLPSCDREIMEKVRRSYSHNWEKKEDQYQKFR